MIHEAFVKGFKGNTVLLEANNPISCGCGSSPDSGTCCSGKPVIFRAKNSLEKSLKQGDRVKLEPPEGNSLADFFFLFMLPAVFSVLLFFLLPLFFEGVSETLRAALSISTFFLSIIIRALLKDNSGSLPNIIEVIPVYHLKKL